MREEMTTAYFLIPDEAYSPYQGTLSGFEEQGKRVHYDFCGKFKGPVYVGRSRE